MAGFPLTQASSAEVLLAVSSGEHTIAAVAATPGWYVISEVPVERSVTAGLDVLARVSGPGVVLNLRIVDSATLLEVEDARVTITSSSAARVRGVPRSLVGNRTYQIQAECIGTPDPDNFGVVMAAALSN